MLTTLHVIFYIFAFIAVCAAVTVITARNPVHSVLALVVTFFSMAGVWMILGAEFLSLILLLVYVGAVMTLFLFVIMMLNIDLAKQRTGFVKYLPFGIILVVVLMGLIMAAVGPSFFGLNKIPAPSPLPENYNNLQYLGALLYNDYAYPFEIAGVLLLAAIIAAITLAHRPPRKRKAQKVSEQIAVRPAERVRLINLPPQPEEGK